MPSPSAPLWKTLAGIAGAILLLCTGQLIVTFDMLTSIAAFRSPLVPQHSHVVSDAPHDAAGGALVLFASAPCLWVAAAVCTAACFRAVAHPPTKAPLSPSPPAQIHTPRRPLLASPLHLGALALLVVLYYCVAGLVRTHVEQTSPSQAWLFLRMLLRLVLAGCVSWLVFTSHVYPRLTAASSYPRDIYLSALGLVLSLLGVLFGFGYTATLLTAAVHCPACPPSAEMLSRAPIVLGPKKVLLLFLAAVLEVAVCFIVEKVLSHPGPILPLPAKWSASEVHSPTLSLGHAEGTQSPRNWRPLSRFTRRWSTALSLPHILLLLLLALSCTLACVGSVFISALVSSPSPYHAPDSVTPTPCCQGTRTFLSALLRPRLLLANIQPVVVDGQLSWTESAASILYILSQLLLLRRTDAFITLHVNSAVALLVPYFAGLLDLSDSFRQASWAGVVLGLAGLLGYCCILHSIRSSAGSSGTAAVAANPDSHPPPNAAPSLGRSTCLAFMAVTLAVFVCCLMGSYPSSPSLEAHLSSSATAANAKPTSFLPPLPYHVRLWGRFHDAMALPLLDSLMANRFAYVSVHADQQPVRLFAQVGDIYCIKALSSPESCPDETVPVHRFVFDPADDPLALNQDAVAAVDAYCKVSLSTEIMINGTILPNREASRLAALAAQQAYPDRLHPGVLRSKRGALDARFFTAHKEDDWPLLVSQSFHSGDKELLMHRERMYDILMHRTPPEIQSRIQLHISDRTGSGMLYSASGLAGQDPGDRDTYLRFCARAWYLLNLSGWFGSQPYRVADSCDTGTLLISDHAFVDAMREFPALWLPANVRIGVFNITGTVSVLQNALGNRQLYDELSRRHRHWCRQNLDPVGYAHQMVLRHLPGRPFRSWLELSDPDLAKLLYGGP